MSCIRAIAISSFVVLTGCGIGSVNPSFTDADARFNKDLLGAWQSQDGTESALITDDHEGGYVIVYNEQGNKSGRFLARGGQIDRWRVLDVQPDASVADNESYKALMLPLHTVIFLDSVGNTVRFRALEPDSITAILEREPNAVAHIKVDQQFVLTASSIDVKKFIATVAARPGVLQEPTTWLRRTSSATN